MPNQTKHVFDKPTTVYGASGQSVDLQPGTHFMAKGWSTTQPSAPTPTPTPTQPSSQPSSQPSTINDIRTNRQKADDFATESLSDVVSPMGVEDIQARESEEKKQRRMETENIFGPKIENARDIGEKKIGSAKGQLGVSRGLGLSTAGQSYIQQKEKEMTDSITEIEKQKQQFISSGNFDAAQRADASIAQLTEFKNNLAIKKAELSLDYLGEMRQQATETRLQEVADQTFLLNTEKLGLDIAQFNEGTRRWEATQAMEEEEWLRDMSSEDRETALEDIARMANSGIPLSSLSDEDITQLETIAELPSGTFEAWYNKLSADAKMGEEVDRLNMQKLRVDIMRTTQLASGSTGTGKGSDDDKISTDFNTDLGAVAQRLKNLRDLGSLNDVNYDLEVSQLMDNYDMPPEQFERVSSLVNQSMQGQEFTTDDSGTISSDFEVSTPAERQSTVREEKAQEMFGKSFDELTMDEAVELNKELAGEQMPDIMSIIKERGEKSRAKVKQRQDEMKKGDNVIAGIKTF